MSSVSRALKGVIKEVPTFEDKIKDHKSFL